MRRKKVRAVCENRPKKFNPDEDEHTGIEVAYTPEYVQSTKDILNRAEAMRPQCVCGGKLIISGEDPR